MRNKGKYAQYFHITPEKGLINDPNGLCYFKGYYHVFYQYNPYACDHSTKYWGHVRSKDLFNWEQLPIALKADDWFDKDGVYSGSAIVHQGRIYLFYTGNTKDEKNNRTSYQCLAFSEDGIHFEKKGPILPQLTGYTGHVRDPKLWFDYDKKGWWMIIGAQREDLSGDTIAYFSKDLENWVYYGSILAFDKPLGYMWECPDLIFLTDEKSGIDKAVFIFSPQGLTEAGERYHNIYNTTYLVGHWDSKNGKFIPDKPNPHFMDEVDQGFEFYAPQTFVDPKNRLIQYAWMGTMPETVEREMPSISDNWAHHLSMPKTLHLIDGQLIQRPLEEFSQYCQEKLACITNQVMKLDGNPTRLLVTFKQLKNKYFEIIIDDTTHLRLDGYENTIKLIRVNWATHIKEVRQASIDLQGEVQIDLWIDSSSIEIFINDGRLTFSARHFADQPLSNVQFLASEHIKYQLRRFTVPTLTFY